jgi:Protein phosphatase 2C
VWSTLGNRLKGLENRFQKPLLFRISEMDTRAYVAHAGDSRCYLYRKPTGLSQITQDHSIVAALVAAGVIKPDDIYTHAMRNLIYRSLGEKATVEVDGYTVPTSPSKAMPVPLTVIGLVRMSHFCGEVIDMTEPSATAITSQMLAVLPSRRIHAWLRAKNLIPVRGVLNGGRAFWWAPSHSWRRGWSDIGTGRGRCRCCRHRSGWWIGRRCDLASRML